MEERRDHRLLEIGLDHRNRIVEPLVKRAKLPGMGTQRKGQ